MSNNLFAGFLRHTLHFCFLFFGLVIFLYGCFQFGALLGLFSHWGNWLKSLLCSLCWITEHGEGGRKCILSSPQSVFLACVAFSSLPHVWNLFRDEALLSLGKTQSCFAYWSAFSRLKFFSVSLCFMLFGGHWMFRFTKKKASILIHLQNHHSEDKTFLFVCFLRTTRSLYLFIFFMLVK